jgi:hypothetical protein
LSKDNYQVFKELRKLQKARIFPDAIPSSSTPSLSSTFPEFSSLIHNCRLSSSSSMLGVQTPEDFNDEAWDFGDEDDLRTPELHTTVVEAAVPQDGINLPNHSLNPALENGSPLASTLEQPLPITHTHTATTPTSDGATYVHSAEEAHTSELQPEPINADDASIYGLNESQLVINSLGSQSVVRLDGENTRLQNDSVLAGPILCTLNTRSSSPSLSYVDGEDSDTTTHPQNDSVLSGPISCTPGTGSSFSALPYVDGEGSDAATHPQNDFVLAGPISCTPSTRSSSPALSYVDDEDPDAVAHLQNDSVLAGPILCMPSTRSSSPTLSYDVDDENPDAAATQLSQIHLSNNSEPIPRTTLDPNMRIEHDGLPIFSSHSTSATEPLTQDFLVESQLESSPSRSLDHPQTMVDSWQNLTTEDEEALEPRLPASEPAAQTMVESWQVLTEEDGEALEPPRLPASEEPAASDTYFDDNEGQ